MIDFDDPNDRNSIPATAQRIVNAIEREENTDILEAFVTLLNDDPDGGFMVNVSEYLSPEEYERWRQIGRQVDNDRVHSGRSWAISIRASLRLLAQKYISGLIDTD